MNISPFTSLAFDAFRKAEAAKRRAAKAESELIVAARRVPAEDREIYFLYTEIMRFEQDRKDSAEAHDDQGVQAAEALLTDYRRTLRDIEAERVITQAAGSVPRPEGAPRAEDVIREGRE
jgi:hypothetical protein